MDDLKVIGKWEYGVRVKGLGGWWLVGQYFFLETKSIQQVNSRSSWWLFLLLYMSTGEEELNHWRKWVNGITRFATIKRELMGRIGSGAEFFN